MTPIALGGCAIGAEVDRWRGHGRQPELREAARRTRHEERRLRPVHGRLSLGQQNVPIPATAANTTAYASPRTTNPTRSCRSTEISRPSSLTVPTASCSPLLRAAPTDRETWCGRPPTTQAGALYALVCSAPAVGAAVPSEPRWPRSVEPDPRDRSSGSIISSGAPRDRGSTTRSPRRRRGVAFRPICWRAWFHPNRQARRRRIVNAAIVATGSRSASSIGSTRRLRWMARFVRTHQRRPGGGRVGGDGGGFACSSRGPFATTWRNARRAIGSVRARVTMPLAVSAAATAARWRSQ
jgi:hypothetical protein